MRKSCSHACTCDPSQIRSSKPQKKTKKKKKKIIFFLEALNYCHILRTFFFHLLIIKIKIEKNYLIFIAMRHVGLGAIPAATVNQAAHHQSAPA
jgi:hypothetical protein